MSRNVSSLFREAAYAQNTDQTIPVLLTIDHPDLAQTERYTNNFQDITSNGDLYTARGFTITLPEDNEERAGRSLLRIDNSDLKVVELIRSITPPPPIMTIQIVRAAAPNVVEGIAEDIELIEARWDILMVEADLAQENYDREPYPKDLMTRTS